MLYNTGFIAFTFNATAGCTYNFNTCGQGFTDRYLRLYNTTLNLLSSADDNCGDLQPTLTWTCPLTASYSILLCNYSCSSLTNNTYLSYNVTCPIANSCNFVVNTYDSYGDGWNGGYLQVNNNGTISNISATGYGTTYNIIVNPNTYISFSYNTGSWENENSYNIINNSITLYTSPLSYPPVITNTYGCNIGLPIELVSFEGNNINEHNLLTWSTASEHNNDYFTIERSIDGKKWSDINIIDGAENSTNLIYYQMYDKTFRNVINYYRLKQTDIDGKYSYSDTIAIDNRALGKVILKVVNSLGQEVELNTSGVVFIIYTNGEIERKFNI